MGIAGLNWNDLRARNPPAGELPNFSDAISAPFCVANGSDFRFEFLRNLPTGVIWTVLRQHIRQSCAIQEILGKHRTFAFALGQGHFDCTRSAGND